METTRREFLIKCLRCALAPGLLVGVGVLAARDPNKCERGAVCRGCRVQGSCTLPAAIAYRQIPHDEVKRG